MKSSPTRTALLILALAAGFAAGCAKKAVQAPPTPPPAPPQTTPSEPPAPPPAPPTPPAPPEEVKLELQPAFFDFDSYTLRDDARGALDNNAKALRANGSTRITIEGHCDERGTVEYNQALGEKRAQAARDYLVGAGIDASRIRVISYGKERPFSDGHDESAWQQNRRAHFTLR
ncbi:MAG TPA: peptidoglycan-associated lipoprotein Pal [Candidatus Eisenbacteria bacterium]|jgi:peptidoglycan-associated lipoprotein